MIWQILETSIWIGLLIDIFNLIFGIKRAVIGGASGVPFIPLVAYFIGVISLALEGYSIIYCILIFVGLLFVHVSCIFLIPLIIGYFVRRIKK